MLKFEDGFPESLEISEFSESGEKLSVVTWDEKTVIEERIGKDDENFVQK